MILPFPFRVAPKAVGFGGGKGVYIEDRKLIDDEGDEKIVTLMHYDFVAAEDEEDEEVADGTKNAADLFAYIPRKRTRRAVPPVAAAAAAPPPVGNQPTEESSDDSTVGRG